MEKWVNIRNGGVDKVEMANEISRDRIAKGADGLLAACNMGVHFEGGVKELVGLAHGHGDAKPIASRRDGLCSQVSILEPRVDSLDALGSRRYELLNLSQCM